jgi:hypothetical protein
MLEPDKRIPCPSISSEFYSRIDRGGLPSCWNQIKDPLTPSLSPGFVIGLVKIGSSNMVSELGGLVFKPPPRIFSLRVILA